jgi:hypothetical protein
MPLPEISKDTSSTPKNRRDMEPNCDLPWLPSWHPWYNVSETMREAVMAFEVGDIKTCREKIFHTKDRLDELLPRTDFDEIMKAIDSGLGDSYFDNNA